MARDFSEQFCKILEQKIMTAISNTNSNIMNETNTPIDTLQYKILDRWEGGFVSEITLDYCNTSLDGTPTFEFDAPFKITEIWGAEIVSQQGNHYTIKDIWWSPDNNTEKTYSFAFKAEGDIKDSPSNFIYSGQLLEGGEMTTLEDKPVSNSTASTDTKPEPITVVSEPQTESTPQLEPVVSEPQSTTNVDGNSPIDSNSEMSTQIDSLTYKIIDQWEGGFVSELTLTPCETSLDGAPTFKFDAPFKITEIWGAEIVSQEGNHYTIKDTWWSADDKTAKTYSFAFKAEGNSQDAPSNFIYNGQPLEGGTMTPEPVATGSDTTGNTDINNNHPAPVVSNGNTDSETSPVSVNPGDNSTNGGVVVDNSNPNGTGMFKYGEALQKSYLFYEAQRAGDLPDNNRIEWRGDAALGDGSDVGKDLGGGYFDAGDHVKFNFPMAYTITTLGWGVQEFQGAYQKSGQLDEALAAVKWGTDYLMKGIVTDESGVKELYGQVGNGQLDHNYWGAPESMTMERPSYKIDREHPGSDLAGETSAALTSASMIFRAEDSQYADTLLNNARLLYDFAEQYQGKYSDSITDASQYYKSFNGYQDELAWGAAWLYKATGEQTYLDKAKSYLGNWLDLGGAQSWDTKTYGTAIIIAETTQDTTYKNMVENWLNNWVSGGNGVQYTEGGLAWNTSWGSLANSSTNAMLAGIYSDKVNDYDGRYANFAKEQVEYILGDNPNGFSYMTGFGDSYPLQPHHRAASGINDGSNTSAANAHIIYGAMVGGPKSANDYDYQDLRSDYVSNEVAMSYNSGLTGALAYMYDNFGGEALSDAELNNLPGISVANV
jgi:endoglucanase